jgi:hypothetical protein
VYALAHATWPFPHDLRAWLLWPGVAYNRDQLWGESPPLTNTLSSLQLPRDWLWCPQEL